MRNATDIKLWSLTMSTSVDHQVPSELPGCHIDSSSLEHWRWWRHSCHDTSYNPEHKTQGMCSRTTWSRPRPRPQNCVLEVEASPRGPPSPGFLPCDATQRAVIPRRLSVHHSQIQCPTAVSCALVYEVLYLSPNMLKNSTSYGQISKPKPRPRIVEAKAKAKGLRGQGHKICPWSRGHSRTPSLQNTHEYIHTWVTLNNASD